MRELLAAQAAELTRSRVPFVQATVVRASRPTSSQPGDTALVLADGKINGFVGGTCAEASVREYSLRALHNGEPLLLRIVPGTAAGAAEQGAVTVANPCLSGGAMEIFLEPRVPAPRVLVVGDTPVAQALAALGGPLDLAVELTDASSADPRPDDAALVVASHGRGEESALTAGLLVGVPYVALVASRVRGAAVVASLEVADDLRSRVHTPAGLALGARTAGEVALSILAQLVELRSRAESAQARVVGAAVTVSIPDTAVDPVCGMTVAAVDATPHLVEEAGTVYFCGEGCRAAFAAEPERYAAAS